MKNDFNQEPDRRIESQRFGKQDVYISGKAHLQIDQDTDDHKERGETGIAKQIPFLINSKSIPIKQNRKNANAQNCHDKEGDQRIYFANKSLKQAAVRKIEYPRQPQDSDG